MAECCATGMILLVPIKRVRVVSFQSLLIGIIKDEAEK